MESERMRLTRSTLRLLGVPVILSLVVSSCASLRSVDAPQPPPEGLLADHPGLPSVWEVLAPPQGTPPGNQRIVWRLEVKSQPITTNSDCSKAGNELSRVWSDGGVQFEVPRVLHTVCRYPDAQVAAQEFSSMTLRQAAGDFYENLDYPDQVAGGPTAIYPAGASSLPLHADEWQIACGFGDARSVCVRWLFWARYGAVTTQVHFDASGGGIRYQAFAQLVLSVDAELASKLQP